MKAFTLTGLLITAALSTFAAIATIFVYNNAVQSKKTFNCTLSINQDMTAKDALPLIKAVQKYCKEPIMIDANGHDLDLSVTK